MNSSLPSSVCGSASDSSYTSTDQASIRSSSHTSIRSTSTSTTKPKRTVRFQDPDPAPVEPSQSTWPLTYRSPLSTCPLMMAHTPVTRGSPPQPPLQSQLVSSTCAVLRRASADPSAWADHQSDETLPSHQRLPLLVSSNSPSGSLAWRSQSRGRAP